MIGLFRPDVTDFRKSARGRLRRWQRCRTAAALLTLVSGFPATVPAAEAAALQDGDVLNREHLLASATFFGDRVTDLVTERYAARISERGFEMTLSAPKPYAADPRFETASAKNAGTVAIDRETGLLTGWTAGAPFPVIDPGDPDAGAKIVWNAVVGNRGADRFAGRIVALNIGAETGVESEQIFEIKRIRYRGALTAPTRHPDDGAILDQVISRGIAPPEIRGVASQTTRFADGRPASSWLVIPGMGPAMEAPVDAWQDDIEGTVQAGDDIGIFGALPTAYRGFRLRGARPLLVVANSAGSRWEEKASSKQRRYPLLAAGKVPPWNVADTWEPRRVYVVEAVPPESHRYGRKVIYVDAETWQVFLGEAYDRKGVFWRDLSQGYATAEDPSGHVVVNPVWGMTVDLRAGIASAWIGRADQVNGDLAPAEVGRAAIERLAGLE